MAIIIDVAPHPIAVLARGSHWLVVDKPCGLSVHNDPGRDLCSLVLAAVRAGEVPGVSRDLRALHAAHRLDRDTSGLVLLAGDAETLAFFGRQFAEGSVDKRYLALVHGPLEDPAAGRDWIEWTWPLTDAAAGREDPMGRGKRLECATRARLLERSTHYSLIECRLLTGRKHQIRRHAKLAGHPVVGDRRYGSTRALTYLRQHHGFERLALHAHMLSVCLPGEEKQTTFESNGLPEEVRRLLEADGTRDA
ncbi:MAG: RNA pseudouridine synthase [Desulfobacteraceae bacterium]|nr:RNA pseudouridine synthase [Desulfobacteraceae bacterium]